MLFGMSLKYVRSVVVIAKLELILSFIGMILGKKSSMTFSIASMFRSLLSNVVLSSSNSRLALLIMHPYDSEIEFTISPL